MKIQTNSTKRRIPSNKRGMSIGVVVVILLTLGMVVGSVLTLTLRTHGNQQDQYVWLDGKNAAEAAVEYGFAQLMDRFSKMGSFPTNSLAPDQQPLSLPDQFFTSFGKTTGSWRYSSIKLPNKATYDPTSKEQWNKRTTDLMGGVMPPGQWKFIDGNTPGNEFDPLKNKLVFVRNVKVYGKATAEDWRGRRSTAYIVEELQVRDAPLFAHTIFYNMDMEVAPGPTMNIYKGVHSNKDVYLSSGNGLNFHGQLTSAGNIYWGTASGFGKNPDGSDVRFANGSGTLVSMKQGGSWLDSKVIDWREKSSQLWDGNVQDRAHGIPALNPVAIPDYQRDNPATGTLDDQLNYAYQLIQPTINTGASSYNKAIEEQKFAYKAGLTIEVNNTTNSYTLYSYERGSDGALVYDASGNPKKIALNLNTSSSANDFVQVQPSATSGGNVTGGLYDARRGAYVSLVRVDMGKLRNVVTNNNKDDWGGANTQKPDQWWNGVVYVKFGDSAPRASDGVAVPINNWGLQLHNGGNIPNPAFAQAKGVYGTTVATNNPVYVQGHYNADGSSSTGSAGAPDNTNEPPAAIVGDAVTLLSSDWSNWDSNGSLTSARRASSFTEVSAAILTGLVPSDNGNNNAYSGGVENFPRFLEDWSNRTIRYRGSMVSLFESEVATQSWGGGSVYNAPIRDWSFAQQFGTGKYPPGTPNSRSFRRINFKELSKAEWDSQMETLKTQMGI